MWASAACCFSSLSFPGRVLQECLGTARTRVLMAGRNIPAPRVTSPGMLCISVCSPYRCKTPWLEPSCPVEEPQSQYSKDPWRKTLFCQMPSAFNDSREPLVCGAVPVTLSLAVTLSLWPRQSRAAAGTRPWEQSGLILCCWTSWGLPGLPLKAEGGRSCIKLISG